MKFVRPSSILPIAALLVVLPAGPGRAQTTAAPPSSSVAPIPPPAPVRQIRVTAKRFEFNPSVIEVSVGELVELTITSLDGRHGFRCPGLSLDGEVDGTRPLILKFKAEKPGEYPFRCSHFCGLGHSRHKGKIVIR
jgi:heme/copper-type cytochrome/quinol oxidase subunit 2